MVAARSLRRVFFKRFFACEYFPGIVSSVLKLFHNQEQCLEISNVRRLKLIVEQVMEMGGGDEGKRRRGMGLVE